MEEDILNYLTIQQLSCFMGHPVPPAMKTNPYLRIRVGKSLNRKRNSLIYNEPTSKENKTSVLFKNKKQILQNPIN